MPQIRHVLGHLTIETAAGKRACHRHKKGAPGHDIKVGETCLVIDTPMMGKQSYCVDSGREILAQAMTDLGVLTQAL